MSAPRPRRPHLPGKGLAIASTLLAGCTVKGPNYVRPAVPLPAAIAGGEATSSAPAVRTVTADPWDRWWTVFRDPELERLVAEARASNLDLRAAFARVRAARALVRGVDAARYPWLSASAAYARDKASLGTTGPSGGADGSFDVFSASGDLSWEIDLFGRTARAVEAACADAAALEEDRRALELVLTADVAQTWFDVGAAEEEARIARDTAELLEKSLGLSRARLESGLGPELDVRRIESDMASAKALVPEAERKRAVAEHRLAVLLGRPPGTRFTGKAPATFPVPPEVPVGLPATLLERRPDLRAAERRLIAANARVGQAVADFYPSVTIAGRVGVAAADLSTLADPTARLWSIGPSIRIPIFQGGSLAAARLEKEALADAATSVYVQVVHVALGEIADALSGVGARTAARDRQREAVAAATRAVELADVAYEKGLTGYVNVLDGQRALATSRLALLSADRQLLAELVRLGKALGGGWSGAPTR